MLFDTRSIFMTLSLMLSLMLAGASIAQAEGEWKELPDMPFEKWEAGTMVLDDKLYFLGGYLQGVKSSKISNIFDPRDGSWAPIQGMPSAITHMNLVLDGRTFWFAGGYKDGYKGHCIREVWNYDVDKDRYTAGPLLPELRGGGGLALIGRNLHYIGGIHENRLTDADDHWVLNLDDWAKGAATWEKRAPIPVARNQFSCVVLKGKIYCIGGQFGHDQGQIDQDRVDIYDPETDSWSEGPSLPKAHSHAEAGTFVYKDKIYMVGGHTTKKGKSKKIDADVLSLEAGGNWKLVAELPMALSSPAAAIIDDKLYVGGGSPNWRDVTKKMWVMDLR